MGTLAKYGSLAGKRVFVTGGGSGIGEAIVAALVEQGALVGFVDIMRDASEALVARLAAAGHQAPMYRYCDITDIPSLQAVMAEMAAELGDFDVVVNNAANDQRLAGVTHDVDEADQRALLHQRRHDRFADPAAAARHEYPFAFQAAVLGQSAHRLRLHR